MYCSHCGQKIEDNAVVCVHCGVALNAPAASRVDPNAKSKLVAGLLGIFLGFLGVHNFYLGYTGKAVAQLLITVLTCFVGSFVTGIWSLIEGILILCGSIAVDGKGNPLKD